MNEILIYGIKILFLINSIAYGLAFIGKVKSKEPVSTAFLVILAVSIVAVITAYGGLK